MNDIFDYSDTLVNFLILLHIGMYSFCRIKVVN